MWALLPEDIDCQERLALAEAGLQPGVGGQEGSRLCKAVQNIKPLHSPSPPHEIADQKREANKGG